MSELSNSPGCTENPSVMCRILAHWQFLTIQNSFLRRVRQSEPCWVLSNRNSPLQHGWASVLFLSEVSNSIKALFTSAGPGWAWPRHLQGRAHKPEFGLLGYRELILGWKIWISQKQKEKPGCAINARVGCAGLCSASGSELGWICTSELLLGNSDFCSRAKL